MVSLAPGSEHQVERHAVDVCFVFDTTGSMSDKIESLIRCMEDFVWEFSRFQLDWRATTVPFGDLTIPGDRIVDSQPFVTSLDDARNQLRRMPRFSGGGNEGESAIEAMLAALRKPFRHRAVKIIILLTDEPALVDQELPPAAVARALDEADAICFVASPDLPYYRSWAEDRGGRWYLIGTSMDTGAVLDFLRSLANRVASVAKAVHSVGRGSVQRYLELGAGDRDMLSDS